MPKTKSRLSRKKILIILGIVVLIVGIYLNRAYAHIFDYDNSRGLLISDIQREYKLEGGQGKDDLKYVVLGDSLSYGFGVADYKGTFPYIVASNLLKNHKQVTVINLAVSGAVLEDLMEMQLPKALEENPGLVSIMIGTNDVHDFVDRQEFKNNLGFVIDQIKEKTKAKILVINIPYLGTRSLILPPYDRIMDERIRSFNKIITEVVKEKSVNFFDLYSVSKQPFLEYPEKYYSIDQFHPSEEGYKLWGELINAN